MRRTAPRTWRPTRPPAPRTGRNGSAALPPIPERSSARSCAQSLGTVHCMTLSERCSIICAPEGRCLASWRRGAASRSRSRCTPLCVRLHAMKPACSSIRCAHLSQTRPFICARRSTASVSAWSFSRASTPEERRQGFAGLSDGTFDIALTTPEFLAWHAEEFASTGRVRFVVVDEAHHVGLARAGQRVAYATIGSAIARLSAPSDTSSASALASASPCLAPAEGKGVSEAFACEEGRCDAVSRSGRQTGDHALSGGSLAACASLAVLALTATAGDDVADAIRRELPVDVCVCDPASRPNLKVDDRRNLKNRDDYLANLVACGEKAVVYVNSRERSVAVARALRKRVPQMAPLIGFYNAGLSRAERKRIEELFRTDALKVLVATSAFGEGVDIPNIRHVVLYHLPFNEIEFNQMSGRAGRDGRPAGIHLLFGRADAGINEHILRDMTPDHDCLAQVYRTLRALQRRSAEPFFTLSDAELADAASTDAFPVSPASAACGVAVFRELGLVETHTAYGADGMARSIHVKETQGKVELTDSVRYREGLGARDIPCVSRLGDEERFWHLGSARFAPHPAG